MKGRKKTIKNTIPLEQVIKSNFNDITHLFVCILQCIVLNKHLSNKLPKGHKPKMRAVQTNPCGPFEIVF